MFCTGQTLRSREGKSRSWFQLSTLLYNVIINQACPEFTVS